MYTVLYNVIYYVRDVVLVRYRVLCCVTYLVRYSALYRYYIICSVSHIVCLYCCACCCL